MGAGRGGARVGSIASFLMLLVFTSHCGGDGEDEGTGGGEAKDASGGTSSGGSGTSDETDPSTGGSSAVGTGGTATAEGGAASGDCSPALSGDPCSEGDSCTWSDPDECQQGQCICNEGKYLCGTYSGTNCNTDTTCPSAIETSCGDTCEGEIKGCLCRCGGGPDYASCSCSGGLWQCSGTSCK